MECDGADMEPRLWPCWGLHLEQYRTQCNKARLGSNRWSARGSGLLRGQEPGPAHSYSFGCIRMKSINTLVMGLVERSTWEKIYYPHDVVDHATYQIWGHIGPQTLTVRNQIKRQVLAHEER